VVGAAAAAAAVVVGAAAVSGRTAGLRRTLSPTCVILACLLFAAGASAQTAQVYQFKRLDVDITVQPDGDLRFVETQEYQYDQGTFTFGFRAIPTSHLDNIVVEGVSEGGRQYREADADGTPNTYRWYVNSDNDFEIRWFYPPTENATRTFQIAYTVSGGLRVASDRDLLAWTAVFPKHFVPIGSSRVTLHLPPGATTGQLSAQASGATTEANVLDAQTIAFAAQNIPDGTPLDVRVQFPASLVSAEPPQWQTDAQEKQLFDSLKYAAGIVLAVIGFPLVFLLWFARGRDAPAKVSASYVAQPPDATLPGVIGTLIDAKAEMRDILATQIDLARRGFLTITQTQHDFVFLRQTSADDSTLRPFERSLLKSLFGSEEFRTLSSLKGRFAPDIPTIEGQMYDEVVAAGYYRESPETSRGRWSGFGCVMMVLALSGLCGFTAYFEGFDAILCPVGVLGLLGLSLFIAANNMPARSAKGAEAAARWQAFKRYLADIEKYTNLKQASDLFEKYLPYAVAFGLDADFTRKFASLGAAPAPVWYNISLPLDAVQTAAEAVQAGAALGAGSGLSAPSLQAMSAGMSLSLQGMSDGLSQLLNASASVLSSATAAGKGGLDGSEAAVAVIGTIAEIGLDVATGGGGSGGVG